MDAEFERTKWDIRPRFRFISGPSRRIGVILVLTVATLSVLGQTALAQTASPTVTPAPTRASTSTPTPTPSPTSTQSPTATATPGAALTLSPQQGPPDTSVRRQGTNFAPGDTVQLLFNGPRWTPSGQHKWPVNFQFSVPNLANGSVSGAGNRPDPRAGGRQLHHLRNGPSRCRRAGPARHLGDGHRDGFQPGETVPSISMARGRYTGGRHDRHLHMTFTIPRLDARQLPDRSRGQTSGDTASATFTVGGASVALSAASGRVGASVTANGSGFMPGDTVRLVFDGSPMDTQNADTNGNVSFNFAIPDVALGNYFVVLSGRTSGSASARSRSPGPA